VGEVRGEGLLAAVEMVANKTTGEAFEGGDIGAYCQQRCQENGLIVRAVAGSAIAFCPPLIISEQQINELIEKFSKALDETFDYVAKDKLIRVRL
jgi:adenosylmethionine-8-amino-7-oxononanoate aminotransferase